GMIQKATFDTKINRIVLPPGCAESYQKYLELAPTGHSAVSAVQSCSGTMSIAPQGHIPGRSHLGDNGNGYGIIRASQIPVLSV
ncbi:MAG: hypothetical protein ACLPWF_15125, partial [Bryobacteraceae bacterium]